MRVPPMVSDFFEWRWAPCVGLTAGSLAFVALALLLIPTRFDGEPRVGAALGSFEAARPQRTSYASSLSASLAEPEERRQDDTHAPSSQPPPSSRPNEAATLRRGFSPIVDRPEPLPPAPVPPPAPVDAPAPPPGTVIVTQPLPGAESRESAAH